MMQNILGKKYLITTHNWFVAPDGYQYKAVFGTFNGITKDKEILGISTNRHSTDWYATIGNMTIAGCQIYYAIQTEAVSTARPTRDIAYEGISNSDSKWAKSYIYLADD